MNIGLWARWLVMHGVPRTFVTVRAWRGDPLAQFIASHARGVDPYPLTTQLRSHDPLVRMPFVRVSVEHGVCRKVLRDNPFGVAAPSDMETTRRLRALFEVYPNLQLTGTPPARGLVSLHGYACVPTRLGGRRSAAAAP
jgi:aminoglycoside phosphotransferase